MNVAGMRNSAMEGDFQMATAKPVPENHHTVTPYIVVSDGAAAIAFYRKAFGATELYRMDGPGGKIMHAEVLIGDSPVMLSDEFPEQGAKSPQSYHGSPVHLFLYVPDVDAWFKRALDAGATVTMPVQDMFWGDRFGQVTDPFGHTWQIATHVEDVAPEEMRKRMEAMA
jgi:PhnB protein